MMPISISPVRRRNRRFRRGVPRPLALRSKAAPWVASVLLLALALPAKSDAAALPPGAGPQEGAGIEVILDAPMADVLQVVEDVANDQVIHGTYVYEKEKTLTGAVAANSSAHFGPWKGPGKALYKVYAGALAPRNFKHSSDIGTITVRYLVQERKDLKTRVQIDAVFVEDGRRTVHESDGTVESSELKEIRTQLQQLQLAQQQAAEAEKQRNDRRAAEAAQEKQRQEERARLLAAESSANSLEEHVSQLRHELVRLVAGRGVELKSAPFHSAVTLQPMPPDSEVLILIVTPYWYGVETGAGRRGWLRRDQVKPIS